MFSKKSRKKSLFFRFSNLKIDVWLKMSVLSKIMENFFLEFFKSLSDAILLKMKKTSKKLDKNDPNQVLHKIWAKHDFSCFRKKVEKCHFFSVFETQNRCLTKNVSFVEEIRRIFFRSFFKSHSIAILLKKRKISKQIEKSDTNQLLHKIWAKYDFSCFRKKIEQNHFFSFFKTQNRCLTKNVSFVEKIRRFFFFNFLNRILTSFC